MRFAMDFKVPVGKWDAVREMILQVLFKCEEPELVHHRVSLCDGFCFATFESDELVDICSVYGIVSVLTGAADLKVRIV